MAPADGIDLSSFYQTYSLRFTDAVHDLRDLDLYPDRIFLPLYLYRPRPRSSHLWPLRRSISAKPEAKTAFHFFPERLGAAIRSIVLICTHFSKALVGTDIAV